MFLFNRVRWVTLVSTRRPQRKGLGSSNGHYWVGTFPPLRLAMKKNLFSKTAVFAETTDYTGVCKVAVVMLTVSNFKCKSHQIGYLITLIGTNEEINLLFISLLSFLNCLHTLEWSAWNLFPTASSTVCIRC